MKLKSGDIVRVTFNSYDNKQHRVILERNGKLRAFNFTGSKRAGGSTTSVQKLLDDGKYQWIGNLEELVEFWQKHHRPPDLEIPGVIRIWVLEEGEGVPHPGCNISPTLSLNMQEIAWIWDGPRREVDSER